MARTIQELADWADPRRTSLLLGAGASVSSGAPTGEGLRTLLLDKLMPSLSIEGDLALTSDVLENKLGRRALIEAVRAIIKGIEPAGGIAAIPRYPWRSIYTTNYDRLVEKAAEQLGIPFAPIRSKFDLPALEELGTLPIFKIHGCVSQDRAFGDPSSLILTKGDYRAVRKWKSDLFRRMQLDLETSQILIIGQSLADLHLDELIEDVVSLQEELGFKNRVSILLFSASPEIQQLFESRGISVTEGDIDWFLSALASAKHDQSVRPGTASTSAAASDLLPETLQPVTIDVSAAIHVESPVRKMFAGAPASYFDIVNGRTFERDQVAAVTGSLATRQLAIILGSAGLGKTTMARQAILQRREQGVAAWEHRVDLPMDVSAWLDVNRNLVAAGRRGVLLLDNATTYQRKVNDLLRALGRVEVVNLEILVTAERHRWDRLSKHPALLRTRQVRVGRLRRTELQRLLRLVADNASVQELVPASFSALSPTQQLAFLERNCAGDIFICLRNVFNSTGFDTIILQEYADLDPTLQEVYKLVAGLEAISGGSHRQLILRMLGMHHDLIPNLLDEMEGLLTETYQSNVEGVFVWRTRHPEIADILTRYKFSDPAEHLKLVEDLVENLNPTVEIERNAIRGLCNNTLGLDFISDRAAKMGLLETLTRMLPKDHVLRHRLVREVLRSGEYGEAEQVLEQSINDVGLDPPLLRYRIELHRARAREASGLTPEDREALLRWAWEECRVAADRYSDNWFTFRSMIEVARDWLDLTSDVSWLREAVDEAGAANVRLFEPRLDQLLSEATIMVNADRAVR